MKDATATVGTSPDVLQHYLTAGIECQVIAGIYKGARAKLGGLCPCMAYPVRLYAGVGMPTPSLSMRFEDVLPVLRPFSALCQPLEDGTVPAVEVAKMILDLSLEHCDADYLAGIEAHMDMHGDCGVYLPDCGGASVNIYNDWLISTKAGEAMTPPAVYDYLRSKHFAVGLAPHQYIEKAAPPTPAPIQEGKPSYE